LSPDEERQQCEEWNRTARPFPIEPTLAALFEEQVSKTPDAIAVEYADRRLTYRELDDRANALACALQNLGVREESRVGICMERGPEMIVAVLGVVKAGAAYVPLDPGYPPARLQFMIEDSGIKVLLTETRSQGVAAELSPEILCVDEIGTRGTKARRVIASADSLAYLMYTSGSTGHPKAVMVSQQAVKRLVLNTDYVDFRLEDRIAQAANASFDAATFEIWGALLNGACVVGLTRAEILSSASFQRTLEAKRITHLFLTTALFNQYAREAKNTFRTVRNLLFGGEAVNVDCVREVLGGSGPERLLHVYGPTECTTFACFHHVETIEPEAQTVPVGRPLANTETYVLDPHGELSPVGAQGELYIGGPGVARGYLNRPDLTAELFVPDRFSKRPGSRLYRTGDGVRSSVDGRLEFLGRIDEQVKIRGFRIELGEIEHHLRLITGVAEALVIARGDGSEKRLIGYVSPQPGHELDEAEISRSLRERLPAYMIPGRWMILERMPQTPNGKLDRKRLPEPKEQVRDLRGSEIQTPTEELIAQIWRDLLKRENVGAGDNFFALGGHSLLATQVVARIRESFGVELPLRHMFELPSLADLAAAVDGSLIDAAIQSGQQDLVDELQRSITALSEAEVEELLSRELQERN
jgi:amino acid adenylation domain-containing protein